MPPTESLLKTLPPYLHYSTVSLSFLIFIFFILSPVLFTFAASSSSSSSLYVTVSLSSGAAATRNKAFLGPFFFFLYFSSKVLTFAIGSLFFCLYKRKNKAKSRIISRRWKDSLKRVNALRFECIHAGPVGTMMAFVFL